MRLLLAAILAILATSALAQSDDEVYTLYRNSVLNPSMRLHVATFDSADGKDYNAENCNLVADLFQRQDDVQTRFWCEPGRYHK